MERSGSPFKSLSPSNEVVAEVAAARSAPPSPVAPFRDSDADGPGTASHAEQLLAVQVCEARCAPRMRVACVACGEAPLCMAYVRLARWRCCVCSPPPPHTHPPPSPLALLLL